MIKPTVGRIVWYYPCVNDLPLGSFILPSCPQEPMAAIVTNVWSDTCVNLCVFDPNGQQHAKTSVYLWQGNPEQDGPRPANCFAEWMPYQKGQAAKTEELAAKVNAGIDNQIAELEKK